MFQCKKKNCTPPVRRNLYGVRRVVYLEMFEENLNLFHCKELLYAWVQEEI